MLNDDIHFNFTTIINNFQKIWSEYKNVGIIGYNANKRTEYNVDLNNDSDVLTLTEINSVPNGFGCCMFMKKDDYVYIDETYKIYWGDTLQIVYTIDEKRKKMYLFDNLITIGRLSVTSQSYEHTMEAEKVMFDQQLIKPRCIPKHRNKNIQKLSYD